MEVHFKIKKGEVIPNIESFTIKQQDQPCPPSIFNVFIHKIIVDVSKDYSITELEYPNKFCPIRATIETIE